MFLVLYLTCVTTYVSSVFHTTVHCSTKASVAEVSQTVDTMMSEIEHNPRGLATWAFAGLGKQEESSKNALYLVWKDGWYDPLRQQSRVYLDILLYGHRVLKDVYLDSYIRDSVGQTTRTINVDVYYSGTILRRAVGTFKVTGDANLTTRVCLTTEVQFGWLFNMLITRKIFSDAIDWRLERLVQNICLRSEGQSPTDKYWLEKTPSHR